MASTHELTMNAMREHGVTNYELMQEMRRLGLCKGKEEEAINRFLKEGRVPVDVAVALFGIIGRQKYLSKPTIH